MGVALRSVAEDGEGFVGENAEIGVFVSVYFGRHGKNCAVGSMVSRPTLELNGGNLNRRDPLVRPPAVVRASNV
jgi:hypothetical protein